MHFDWSTFALQTVNFAILVWLLQRYLYRPVLRLVDARRAEVDRHFAEARAAEEAARAERGAIEAARAGVAAERTAALKEASSQAEAAAALRRAQAECEAAAVLDGARKALADERRQALAEARRAALALGGGIAVRLLAEVPASLRAEAWIERIEQYLTALPPAERGGLARQLADGAVLRVVTAAALPADVAQLWRSRLARLFGDAATVVLAVDPQLVAGAELHFPNAILRFSWQSALAAMRSEIERELAGGDAGSASAERAAGDGRANSGSDG